MFTWALQYKSLLLRSALFRRSIFGGHAICINEGVLTTLHHPDPSGEPTPAFASDAEIELAEQLRHQLEARLLETSVKSSSSKNTSAETSDSIKFNKR